MSSSATGVGMPICFLEAILLILTQKSSQKFGDVLGIIVNLTLIGYFQSIERVRPAMVFALLRGLLLLVPSFIILPVVFGETGIWLALAVSELLTMVCIIGYMMIKTS